MQKKVAIIISPNWQDYAKKYIDDCLKGVRTQDYKGEIKIFITDNETTENSFSFLKEKMPEAEITRNKENDGFAKGCNDSMKKALAQGFDYIFNLSIHSIMDPDCISRLVQTAESDSKIGAVQTRCMLWSEKDKILSLGNATYFLGFGYCNGYKEKMRKEDLRVKNIHYPSGGAFFLKRQVLEEVGFFDEEYWMYNEDQELGWRIWLSGRKCVLSPQAVMYSKFDFLRSIKKYYWMDRNRILAILECYHILTLILILPAFIIMELGLILFSLKTGWFLEKIKVWGYFLKPGTWKYIKKARKRNQGLRKIKDKEIVPLITGKIWYQEVDDWKLKLVNPIFSLYWNIAKKLIIW